MKQLIIFDLDGTLLNTIDDLGNATNFALRKMEFTSHPLAAYNYMVGNGVRKLMERAAPDASPETVDELLKYFREYYDQHSTDFTRPYPGIQEMIAIMQANNVRLAVTSNKYQAAVDRIINHFFPGVFSVVLGEVPERPKKPDPSIVFTALSECPTPKRDVLYCGDSAVDIETARRACIESVGVTWGFRPVSELRTAYADHIVSSPDEILEIAGIPI